jgi:hypothetical protein
VLTAVRVRGIEAAEDVELYGAIHSFSDSLWRLSAIPVEAADSTLVLGQPALGLLAHAAADLSGTGTLTARVFNVAWQEPNGWRQPRQGTGTVDALPGNGLMGRWQIAGQSVEVTPATQMFQVKALIQVGAHVQFSGWQGSDHIVATSITVLSNPCGNAQAFTLRGTVEALPQGRLLGTWTIAGQQVQVMEQTRLHNQEQIRLGAPVEIGGLQYLNGQRVMTWLRIREMSGPGPQPSVTPQATRTPQGTCTPRATRTPGT